MKELDKWIAEKVMGLKLEERYGEVVERVCEGVTATIRSYTTDLNLAVEAAEKVEFWKQHIITKHKFDNKWQFAVHEKRYLEWGPDMMGMILSHENLASAICLAIFKIKTGKDWNQNKKEETGEV